jgi:hypothetical protein
LSTSSVPSSTVLRVSGQAIEGLDPEEECNNLPEKPKRMHWRTYNRLVERYEHYDGQWALAVMRRLRIKL